MLLKGFFTQNKTTKQKNLLRKNVFLQDQRKGTVLQEETVGQLHPELAAEPASAFT